MMENTIIAFTLLALAILASLIAWFIGFIAWVVLNLMKEMLHLKIKIGSGKEDK
jgi:hypothetical protein